MKIIPSGKWKNGLDNVKATCIGPVKSISLSSVILVISKFQYDKESL